MDIFQWKQGKLRLLAWAGVALLGHGVVACGTSPATNGGYWPADAVVGGDAATGGNAGADSTGAPDTATSGDAVGGNDGAAGSDAAVLPTPGGDLVVTKGHSPKGESWTILVYMHADNDLESFALGDLQEMAEVGSGAKLKIVVQIDRAEGYTKNPVLNLLNFTTSKRLLVEKGKLTELADLGELNRDNPQTLREFLGWGLQNYPSDHVALIMWDHGSGVGGFGGDDSEPFSQGMSLPQIASALQEGLQAGGRDRLDLLGFDACLMASFEVAASVAPYAEYLLASEELEPGHGWDYRSLQVLTTQPGAPVPVLAKRIADDFLAYGTAAKTAQQITLSLVDLTLLDAVGAAVDTVAAEVEKAIPQATSAVIASVKASYGYGKKNKPNTEAKSYDLGQVASQLAVRKVLGPEQAGTVNAALQQAVVYKVAGPPHKQATGLSIAFPSLPSEDVTAQIAVPGVAAWRSMLETVWAGGKQAIVASFAALDGKAELKVAGTSVQVSGALKPGHGAAVVDERAYVGAVSPEGDQLVVLVEQPADRNGDQVFTSWDREYLMATSNTGSGPVTATVQEMADGILLLETQYWFGAGAEGGLLTHRYYMDGSGNLLGDSLFLTNNGLTAEYEPQAGDQVRPLLQFVGADGNVQWLPADETLLDLASLSLAVDTLDVTVSLFGALQVQSAGGETDEVFNILAGTPVVDPDVCGDGACTGDESEASCAKDCASAGSVCGDNICSDDEDPLSCLADCGCVIDSECGTSGFCADGFCFDQYSCENRCGYNFDSAACQCDSACWEYDDCCEDIGWVCGG